MSLRMLTVASLLCILGACQADDRPSRAADADSGTADVADRETAAPDDAAGADTAGAESGSDAPDDPETPFPDEPVLTAEGWGPLRIGMTAAEVTAAAGPDANPGAVGGPDPEQCDEYRPDRAPAGMIVMIERGVLTRISVGAQSDVRTDRGFRVGDTATAIHAAYGDEAEREPHKYVAAPAEYVTIWTVAPPSPQARGLVYEIGGDGRVMHIRGGGASIRYVEGCL